MFIKDRGNIKWTSLMLTEHRDKLKELMIREDDRGRPEIDEQKYQEMETILKKALSEKKPVGIIYYWNKRFKICQGKVRGFNPFKKELIIEENEKGIILIQIGDIIDVKV